MTGLAKERVLWLAGWIVYPLVVALDGGSAAPEYHEARLAIRDWLRSKPDRARRLRAHELTREPHGGWVR